VSILAPNFGSVSASLQPDGTVLLEWAAKTNNPVSTKTPESVNVYRSLAYEESYVKINLTPLPLSGSYTDANPYKHVTTYYRFELVFDDGSASAEKTDIRWVEPAVEPTDFEISVQEDTMAAVKGDEAVYCVQVISKGGYTGTVTLDAADLPPAYATYDFDPAVVSVPGGSSTLTVQWDGSTPAPPGGTAYPFQVTGDDGTDTVRTVDLLGVVIDPSDHYLTQFVYPVQPHAGRSITVWGRLTPQQDGQIVEVELAGTDAFYTTESDETGFFSVAVPVNTAETHTIRSSYGSTQSAQYDIDVWRGTRYIDMTASTADGTIEPGDLVALDGKITPNPGEEQIYLEIFNQDKESYAFKGNVSVDGYGTFHNTFFAQEGMTAVDVEFDGDADYYNATASLNVPANAPIGMAIVVAGGGQLGNTLWEATEALCDRAYNVFVGRLIPEDQICYLHPDPNHDPDDDEIPERCKDATATKLQEAIEVWALDYVDTSDTSSPFKTPLTIYLMGLEESPGVYRINESETVTTAQLATWIEHFVTNVKALYTDPEIPAPQTVPVNVVLEFKRSGQFVDELTGSDRIVVTSTGDGSTQYPGYNHVSDLGDVSFSHTFYDSINMGKYIAEGWAEAAEQMGDFEDPTSGFAQKPLIDANGDGTPNQAQDTNSEIGAGNKLLEYRNTYDVRPEIRSIFPVLTIPLGHSDATVWAQVLDHDEGLDKIKCMILPPHDSSESMREYPMVFNDLMNRYELTHDGFHSRGTYRILITAMDLDGDHALVKDSKIHVLLNTSEEDTTAPADVSGLSAIAEDQQVSLSWAVSSSDDLAGYRVYTKASGGTYGSGIYIGNDDHYTVTGLTNGLSYVFKVTAEDEVPNESEGVETGPVSPRGAQFIADTTEVLPGGTVQFTDQSTGSPTGYEWDLDGDDVIDSTDPNPSFTYNALGTYTVKLKATYADAWSFTV